MSDTMLYGVLQMPYELAMGDELSRMQFYQRAQEALQRMKIAEQKLKQLGHDKRGPEILDWSE